MRHGVGNYSTDRSWKTQIPLIRQNLSLSTGLQLPHKFTSMASTAADSGRKTLSKADRIRDREVFHLFPSTSGGKSVARIPLIEPDPVLTALAQLAAIRLDVSRALIK